MHKIYIPKSDTNTFVRQINVLVGDETIVSVRQPNRRIQALAILDEIQDEYEQNGKSAKMFTMTNELYRLLIEYFLPTIPPTEVEQVEEIRLMFRGTSEDGTAKWHEQNWNICYNSTFAIYIIRDALKNRKLPIIQASGWRNFAHEYFALVMAA